MKKVRECSDGQAILELILFLGKTKDVCVKLKKRLFRWL